MSLKLLNTDIGVLKVLTGYDAEIMYFSLSHPISRNKTIKVVSGTRSMQLSLGEEPLVSPIFTTCREVFTSSIRRLMAGMCLESIKPDKLRMLIFYKHRSRCKNNKPAGKNVLNAFNVIEKEKGWKPSKVYKVKTITKELPNLLVDCYLFIGPRQWISSPYMASLYALLTRIILRKSLNEKEGSKNLIFDDLDDLTRKIENIKLRDVERLYARNNEESDWRVIIDNYETLHKGNVAFRWFSDAVKNSSGYTTSNINRLFSDGPDSLINDMSYNGKMQERYNEILNG